MASSLHCRSYHHRQHREQRELTRDLSHRSTTSAVQVPVYRRPTSKYEEGEEDEEEEGLVDEEKGLRIRSRRSDNGHSSLDITGRYQIIENKKNPNSNSVIRSERTSVNISTGIEGKHGINATANYRNDERRQGFNDTRRNIGGNKGSNTRSNNDWNNNTNNDDDRDRRINGMRVRGNYQNQKHQNGYSDDYRYLQQSRQRNDHYRYSRPTVTGRYSTGGQNNNRSNNRNSIGASINESDISYRRYSDYSHNMNRGGGKSTKEHQINALQRRWSAPHQNQNRVLVSDAVPSRSRVSASNEAHNHRKNNNDTGGVGGSGDYCVIGNSSEIRSDSKNSNGTNTEKRGSTYVSSTSKNDWERSDVDTNCNGDGNGNGNDNSLSGERVASNIGKQLRKDNDASKPTLSDAKPELSIRYSQVQHNTEQEMRQNQSTGIKSADTASEILGSRIDNNRSRYDQDSSTNKNISCIAQPPERLCSPPLSLSRSEDTKMIKCSRDRDRYLPPGKRICLERDNVVSGSDNKSMTKQHRNNALKQSLEEGTNAIVSKADPEQLIKKESSHTKKEIVNNISSTGVAIASTNFMETAETNHKFKKGLDKAKSMPTAKIENGASKSASFLSVKKKVQSKPTTNRLGIPMSWLKPKAKPVPKKKISPPQSLINGQDGKKKSVIKPSSSPTREKCLVTDSSEGGSIVSDRNSNNNSAKVLNSVTQNNKKQKRNSVPSAIVTNKKNKKENTTNGDNYNNTSDNSNDKVVKDEWDSDAESDPEEPENDSSDSDDFESDVEGKEVYDHKPVQGTDTDSFDHNDESSTTDPNPPKSPKLTIRLSSAKLEKLSKSRHASESQNNSSTTSENENKDKLLDASIRREKRKQEKLMALSIMIHERPEFDHEKAKKEMEEEKRKREESKPLTAKQIRKILRNDDSSNLNQSNWVRRSRRQPNRALLRTKEVKMLIEKLKMNDSDMVVLKMKKYVVDPNVPSAVLDSVLNAMEENTNCEALYIQNFNEGMRDKQVLHLLRILQQPSCNIWCLNIGENYNVSDETWGEFTKGLIHTKITHMYASEHTITTDMKDEIRFTIRENRKKHDMHINPNNLDVIIQCTHCWWNPVNAKLLRPYLKKKGYEHVLNDKEAQGLRGSNSAAPTK